MAASVPHDATLLTAPSDSVPNDADPFDRTISLLRSRDDTSRFVGLALVKSLLDNQPALREDAAIISQVWAAISPTFLDRLLRAEESGKKTKEEAKGMVDLAVAVIHSFTVLLPEETRGDERLVGRAEGLVACLVKSDAKTTTQILQVLLTFASNPKGVAGLWAVEDLSPLLEMSNQPPLVMDIVKYMTIYGCAQPELRSPIAEKLDSIVSVFSLAFRHTKTNVLLQFLAEVLPQVTPELLNPNPPWLSPVTTLLRNSMTAHPSFATREASSLLSSALLQLYPLTFPSLLFRSSPSHPSSDSKPIVYLFINLSLIDIRTTFLSLMEILASPEYPKTSRRLAASFEVVAAFIGFLVRSLEDEEGDEESGSLHSALLAPDLLLKLRRDISETMSLTIEYLRDRWDSTVAGAAGLHPSVRPSPDKPPAANTTLSLTWDSKDGGIVNDPLILAAVRTLALWLRDDDNDRLRQEAAGIMDVLLGLYKLGMETSTPFQSPVLTALEGILTTDASIDAFLQHDGWTLLWADLSHILSSEASSMPSSSSLHAIEIIRTLLTVAENSTTTGEAWMPVVKAAASSSSSAPVLRSSLLQLATELLARAPRGTRSRYASEAAAMERAAKELLDEATAKLTRDTKEVADSAREVVDALGTMTIQSTWSFQHRHL